MSEIIKVGMADLKTCVSPDGVTTLGLGSCVGIAIRDPVTKIGGLAHIMLPDSTTIRNSSQNIAKFADTGIDELVRQMEKLGARKARMVAKIAGGATMFTFQGRNDMMQVGERNVQAVKKKLKEINIPILAEDTGKNIPVDELRERISEIEKGKPVYLICQSGLRSYIASRILEGNGYETYNFSGGFRFYDAVVNDRALIERAYACGMDY